MTNIGTQVFKGTNYDKYAIEWSAGQNWNNGPSGQVPGGAVFHIGATFSGVDFDAPDDVIINKLQLLDAAGTPLALQPRLPGMTPARSTWPTAPSTSTSSTTTAPRRCSCRT